MLTEQELKAQTMPGRGVSARYGPKPPTPDEVAARGTKAWRDAWRAQDEWRNYQTHSGATAYDLGLRDEKELGKHFFTRMRMGEYDPRARGNWIAANQGSQRGSYRPNDTNFYPFQGGTLGSFAGLGASASPGAPIYQAPTFQGGMSSAAPAQAPGGVHPSAMLIRRGRKPGTLGGLVGG
jgi:hypothetical protein